MFSAITSSDNAPSVEEAMPSTAATLGSSAACGAADDGVSSKQVYGVSSKQVFVAAPLVPASPPHVVLARASVDARGEVGCAIFPRWMKLLRWRLLLAAAAVSECPWPPY